MNAEVDADGSGKDIQMVIEQLNDKCDDASCFNDYAHQRYFLEASGTSKIDVTSSQGFEV